MTARTVRFENDEGQQLAGKLDLPADGAPEGYAILAHCFTCSKDLKGLRRLGSALAQAGYAVLRLDFTGLGESEGEFTGTTFSSNVGDLLAAAAYLERDHAAPTLLVGHSLGGAAVLAAAPHLPSVQAVATIGAPADPRHVEGLLSGSREVIERDGEAEVNIGGRPFRLKRSFLDDLRRSGLPERVSELRRPLLILHAPLDAVVGIDEARRIFQSAVHPKSFVSLDGADHLLTRPADAEFAGRVIASWAQRYLDPSRRASWKDDVRDGRVAARTEEGLRTDLLANGFDLTADEPTSVGGTNAGPTPYDLLASALAACTSMTLRLYADRKGWPLRAAEVHVHHTKAHAEDGGRDQPGRIDRFERVVELHGPLDETQRSRLLEIANRCPVHRSLETGPIEVDTRLAGADAGPPSA